MSDLLLEKVHGLQGQVMRFEPWHGETLEDVSSISFGDLKRSYASDSTDSLVFVSDFLCGSDYSGDSVTVSNHRVFLQMFGAVPGVYPVHGGHGSYGVAIRLDVDNSELFETLGSLELYPLLDSEDLCQVEFSAQDTAWASYLESDFRRGLQDLFDLEVTLDADQLWELFETGREAANEEWRSEIGNIASICLERILGYVTREDVDAILSTSAQEVA